MYCTNRLECDYATFRSYTYTYFILRLKLNSNMKKLNDLNDYKLKRCLLSVLCFGNFRDMLNMNVLLIVL